MDEERAGTIRYKDCFDMGTDPYVYPNCLPYFLRYCSVKLRNPKIRVDVAYSVFSHENYELLPQQIAAPLTLSSLTKQSFALAESKRSRT